MAWQTPKTDWKAGNIPTAADFNRIEGNINYIEQETRTPNQAVTPAASGPLGSILNFFAAQIKRITGKTNWYDAPDTTLAAAKSHIDAAAPHSGHETPSGAQAKVDTHNANKQGHGATGSYYIAKTSRSDQLPAWNDIQGKPSSFTPSPHKTSHASGGTDALTPADIGAVNKSGDTMTGELTIVCVGDRKIYLRSADADNYCLISVQDAAGTELSTIGYERNAWKITGNPIWHAGNQPKITVSSTAPSAPAVGDLWVW